MSLTPEQVAPVITNALNLEKLAGDKSSDRTSQSFSLVLQVCTDTRVINYVFFFAIEEVEEEEKADSVATHVYHTIKSLTFNEPTLLTEEDIQLVLTVRVNPQENLHEWSEWVEAGIEGTEGLFKTPFVLLTDGMNWYDSVSGLEGDLATVSMTALEEALLLGDIPEVRAQDFQFISEEE